MSTVWQFMYSFIKNIKSNMLKFTEKVSDDSAGPVY